MDDGITVEYKLTIDGDKLKGKGAAEFGGEKREWDIEGKREKNDKSSPQATPALRPCRSLPARSRRGWIAAGKGTGVLRHTVRGTG